MPNPDQVDIWSELTSLSEKAVKKFGIEAQLMQAIEELNELAVALCHVRRKRVVIGADQVVEEVADVLIMLGQIRHLMLLDNAYADSQIDEAVLRKLARLKLKLEKE